MQPPPPLLACLTQGTCTVQYCWTRVRTVCLHFDIPPNTGEVCVQVCVRPLMYMYRSMCMSVQTTGKGLDVALPNCKTGLEFIFVMWKQGPVLLEQTSAKNRPTHLVLIKTAWLYSCSSSDLQASGKSREEKKHRCVHITQTHTHTFE